MNGGDFENWPRITIVTPSMNQGRFIEQTIHSVLDQHYPNLEYIIMDGGSTDETLEIIHRYSPRIDYWVSERDKGQADAIYRGFERATGEIIGWLNSDDLFMPGALRRYGRYFAENPQTELVMGGCLWIDENGEPIRTRRGFKRYHPGFDLSFRETLLYGCGSNQPAMLWRRSAFFKVGGFDRSLYCCFDYDLFLRLSKRGKCRALKMPGACYRVQSSSKTTRHQELSLREAEQLRARFGIEGYSRANRSLRRKFFQLRDLCRFATGSLASTAWSAQ